jgi:NNP family nitrate/nitrite transporter-like MFS transporter
MLDFLPLIIQFGLSLVTAGGLGALFGLMNLFSRASGGMLSDLAAIPWGMRGRMWCLWIIQTLSGVFCIVMYSVDYSLGATIAVMLVFSIFCQQACGAHVSDVPLMLLPKWVDESFDVN